MSEDEARRAQNEEAGDDVEGHKRPLVAANEEPAQEGDDDDVEAHKRSKLV